jgi:hypothetical protein
VDDEPGNCSCSCRGVRRAALKGRSTADPLIGSDEKHEDGLFLGFTPARAARVM